MGGLRGGMAQTRSGYIVQNLVVRVTLKTNWGSSAGVRAVVAAVELGAGAHGEGIAAIDLPLGLRGRRRCGGYHGGEVERQSIGESTSEVSEER